ncbi:MAG: NAD(P)/FAD-dependent oxidoreductase [Candidatus Dormibacteraceae bacterium]
MGGSAEPTAEVLVLGGGVVGLCVAHGLRQAGVRRVTVVERERCGEGSTMRATGGIRTQFGNPLLVRLSLLALDSWRHWGERYGGDAGYRPVGYVFLATTPGQLAQVERGVALQRSLGARVERLGPGELAARLPGVRLDGVLGGSLGADDGLADPGAAVTSLVAACRRSGVRIEEATGDAALAVEGGQVAGVRTARGVHRAERVVVATGAWTAPLLEPLGVALPIEPHHRQVYRATLAPGVPANLPLVVDRGTGVYFHGDGEGLVFGGGDRSSEAGWDARFRPQEAPRVVELLAQRLPAMVDAGLTGGWAGLREMTPDDLGVVGPIDGVDGLWVAAGFSGHGFMHAPAIGGILASQITGGRPALDVTALAASRFEHPVEGDPYAF